MLLKNNKVKKEEIEKHAKNSYTLVHEKTVDLINSFLELKKIYGTKKEKILYTGMQREHFVQRLMEKRPAVFYGADNETVLRDGQKVSGEIGYQWEPTKRVLLK